MEKERFQLYHCWYALKQRCVNSRNCSYKYYGAKGITFTHKWNTFEGFLADMLLSYPGYEPYMSIDRIDNNKGYYKENCRWMPLPEQNKKHSKNVPITYKGETLNIAEWERRLGMKKGTLQNRIQRLRMPIDHAIEMPVATDGIVINGKRIFKKDLAAKIGICPDTITRRVRNGATMEEALDKDYGHKKMAKFASARKRGANGTFLNL